jgi:hypothetical protein
MYNWDVFSMACAAKLCLQLDNFFVCCLLHFTSFSPSCLTEIVLLYVLSCNLGWCDTARTLTIVSMNWFANWWAPHCPLVLRFFGLAGVRSAPSAIGLLCRLKDRRAMPRVIFFGYAESLAFHRYLFKGIGIVIFQLLINNFLNLRKAPLSPHLGEPFRILIGKYSVNSNWYFGLLNYRTRNHKLVQ